MPAREPPVPGRATGATWVVVLRSNVTCRPGVTSLRTAVHANTASPTSASPVTYATSRDSAGADGVPRLRPKAASRAIRNARAPTPGAAWDGARRETTEP